LAAANPIGGRYDASLTFSENVELTDPILQRFDVLCVLQDKVDPVSDEKLAKFVIGSHHRSHPDGNSQDDLDDEDDEDVDADADGLSRELGHDIGDDPLGAAMLEDGPEPLDQAMLKKYIMYAKAYVKPVLHEIDAEKVSNSSCLDHSCLHPKK